MKHNLFLGVLFALSGAFLYSTQTALIKAQASILPPIPVVIFIQSVISLTLILPLMFKKGLIEVPQRFKTQQLKLQFLRTIFSLALSYALFYAVQYIPLVNAMLLANTAPLIVPFLAYLFLAKKINHRLWVPILIGFTGVALVLRPGSVILDPASLLALGAAVLMAATVISVRKLSKTDSTETTGFYFFLFSTIISGVIATQFWVPITSEMFLMMLLIGVIYFLTQYASMNALRFASAQLVSTLFYSNIIYAAIISFVVWNTVPSLFTLCGMLLIVFGGILCIRESHQLQKRNELLQKGDLQYVKEN